MNKIELPEFTITGIEQPVYWSNLREPEGVILKLSTSDRNVLHLHKFNVEFSQFSAKDFRIGQKVKVSFEFGE